MRRSRIILIGIVLVVFLIAGLAFCRSRQETDIEVVGTPTAGVVITTPQTFPTQTPAPQISLTHQVPEGIPSLGEPSLNLPEDSLWRVLQVWENSEVRNVGGLDIVYDLAQFQHTETGQTVVGRCTTPGKLLIPEIGMIYRVDYRNLLQPVSPEGIRLIGYQEFLAYPRR